MCRLAAAMLKNAELAHAHVGGSNFGNLDFSNLKSPDHALSTHEMCELQLKTFDERSKPFAIGGVFSSYSLADSK